MPPETTRAWSAAHGCWVDTTDTTAEPTPEQEAIAAVLRDLDQLVGVDLREHPDGCWRDGTHGRCLAARIRRTLEGTTDAT